MNRLMIMTIALVFELAVPMAANAQNKVTTDHIAITAYSMFVKNGMVPVRCQAEVNAMAQVLSEYPHPQNWRFVLVCDEASWKRAVFETDIIGRDHKNADDLYGITSQGARWTLIRGSRFDVEPAEDVVVHELVHIALKSHDDYEVDRVTDQWIRAHHDTQAASTVAMR